jgi:hypothetical protein
VFTARYGLYLCFLCESEIKQRLSPYTALTEWFLEPSQRVFTARYGLYLCVLCESENIQRLFPYTSLSYWFYNRVREYLQRGTDCVYVFCVNLRTNRDYFNILH